MTSRGTETFSATFVILVEAVLLLVSFRAAFPGISLIIITHRF